MIKNIIAPIQSWLLLQKRCVGCGMPLNEGIKKKIHNRETITCKCRRIYINVKGMYRRARLDEV